MVEKSKDDNLSSLSNVQPFEEAKSTVAGSSVGCAEISYSGPAYLMLNRDEPCCLSSL